MHIIISNTHLSLLVSRFSLLLNSHMSNSKTTSITLNSGHRLKKRSTVCPMMGMDEKPDLISTLPDNVLSYILSFLSIDEAVRSGVLSSRWKNLWRETSHVEFDGKKMIRPLTQLLHSREPPTVLDLSLDASMRKGVYRYGFLVYLLLLRHSGQISSSRFVHLRKSLVFGEVQTWVVFLLKNKKMVKDLSLECEPDYGEIADHFVSKDDINKPHFPHGIFSSLGSLELINYTIDCWDAFVCSNNLKNLKLKKIYLEEAILHGILKNCVVLENFDLRESVGFTKLNIMHQSLKVLQLQALFVDEIKISCKNLEDVLLDSIICPTKAVSICAPKLRQFRSYCYSTFGRMLSIKEGKSILKTHEILAHCNDFLVSSFH